MESMKEDLLSRIHIDSVSERPCLTNTNILKSLD